MITGTMLAQNKHCPLQTVEVQLQMFPQLLEVKADFQIMLL